MSLDIDAVFEDGFDALLSEKGLVLGGLFVVVSLVSTVLVQSFALGLANYLEARGETTQQTVRQIDEQIGCALDIGLGPAIGGLLAFVVVGELVRVVAARALGDRTTGELEPRHYGDGLLRLFVYRLVAAVVLGILYVVLFAILVAPALLFFPLLFVTVPLFVYLVLPLYLAPVAIAVDEVGPLEAIGRVWRYANGNRIRIFLVAIGVAILNVVISSPTYLFSASIDLQSGGGDAFAQSAPALLVSVLVGAVSTVFVIAMTAATYNNLKDDAAPPAETVVGSDEFGSDTQF